MINFKSLLVMICVALVGKGESGVNPHQQASDLFDCMSNVDVAWIKIC